MNERRLEQAAAQGRIDFTNEWIDQGGEPARAGAMFYAFRDAGTAGETSYSRTRGRSTSSGSDGNIIRSGANVIGQGLQYVQEGIGAGHEVNITGMRDREFINLGDTLNLLINESGKLRGPLDMVGNIVETAAMGVIDQFRMQNFLLEEMNQRTGMLGDLSREFREEITNAYPEAIRLGISFDDLTESVVGLVEESGKFKLLSEDTIEEMAMASAFAKDMTTYAQMAIDFEKVSMGIHDMTEATNAAGKDSMAIGINARRTVSDIQKNLELLNRYGFERGVEGLTEMVQQSIEFRSNIMDVAGIADKVWDPEGALEMVANLQVIGGAIGDFNDPLKLMYMATNNIEGLQDALLDASKALVTYNNEQGRFEVTGANLRRAKAMADELGMSMEDLTRTAVASMERTTAASELMAQGLALDEEDREFLINMAQMRDGRMTIEIPRSMADELGLKETNVALSDMSEGLARDLVARREQLQEKTMEEINREQVSLIANIGRQVSYIAAMMRVQAGDLGTQLAQDLGFDPLKAQNQLAEYIDKEVTPRIEGVDWANEIKRTEIGKQIFGEPTNTQPIQSKGAPQTQTETATTTEPTETKRVEVTLNFKANANMNDSIMRSVYNDPMFQYNAKNSFLEMWGRK